ncbi:hypothetical protein J3R83DRAFT_14059 [Lanmaoa asiatica]|nr:hypothetical protein J3R83DRAFT_14059 [Lanmaoa asiatica]
MLLPLDEMLIFYYESSPSAMAMQTPLSRLPATEPEALAKALGRFSLWLSTPDVISSPRLFPLSSSLPTAHVHRGALQATRPRVQRTMRSSTGRECTRELRCRKCGSGKGAAFWTGRVVKTIYLGSRRMTPEHCCHTRSMMVRL